jgi:hypothetical protein
LTGRYYDAVGQANLGYGIDSTFYENGATSTDVQVCLAAGTPVVLVNNETKPIEEIKAGGEVYAKPHDNPTGELVKCKVTRVFHNAPQSTLKLTFYNGLVIRATKEHPFYVVGKGWVSTGNLEIGTECISTNSTATKLLSKELVEEKVPVYNFEVEDAPPPILSENRKKNPCWCIMHVHADGIIYLTTALTDFF